MSDTVLNAALEYARRGWSVRLLVPPLKNPLTDNAVQFICIRCWNDATAYENKRTYYVESCFLPITDDLCTRQEHDSRFVCKASSLTQCRAIGAGAARD
jgi:hypothetical protein